MWKELWRILRESETLLDEARIETLDMLDQGQEMFEVILKAMVGEVHDDVLEEIAGMDRALNESQKRVRKKVFEHLAASKGTGILTGLVLTSVVIDLERIGDYTKNMGEIVSFIPGQLDFGEKTEIYESVCERTKELFSLTRAAFGNSDAKAAVESVKFYHGISRDVDTELREFMRTGAPEDQVEKRTLALAMLLRYMKRVGAHLKNICTTVSNPFPEIGYRPS